MERLHSGDPEVVKNWTVLKRMFEGLSSGRSEQVRPELRDVALQLFNATAESARQLLFAERVPEVATGLRGASSEGFRELYEFGDHEVDLAWMEDEVLVGQLMVPEIEAGIVGGACILYGGEVPRQVALEPMGEFEMESVAPGSYELAIETRDHLLVIPELEFPAH